MILGHGYVILYHHFLFLTNVVVFTRYLLPQPHTLSLSLASPKTYPNLTLPSLNLKRKGHEGGEIGELREGEIGNEKGRNAWLRKKERYEICKRERKIEGNGTLRVK